MTPSPLRLLFERNPADARLVLEALAEQAPGEFAVTTAGRLAEALAALGTLRRIPPAEGAPR